MVAKRDAVSFVAYPLEELERRARALESDRHRYTGNEDLFLALRECDDGDARQIELLHGSQCRCQLPFPPVDDYEIATVEAALGVAADHGATLGAAARAYVERQHALPDVADAYVRAIESAAGGDAVNDAVLHRIAEAASEVGIADASALARAARESGIIA